MVMQVRRTLTVGATPTGLLEGQISVGMADQPPTAWVGVPTSVNPAGVIPITGLVRTVAGAPQPAGALGQLWWDEDAAQLFVYTGNEWVVAVNTFGGSSVSFPPSPAANQVVTDSVTGATWRWDAPTQRWVPAFTDAPSDGELYARKDGAWDPIVPQEIYTGPTPPPSPSAGDLWFDTSQDPPVLMAYDGSNWNPASPTDLTGFLPISGGELFGSLGIGTTIPANAAYGSLFVPKTSVAPNASLDFNRYFNASDDPIQWQVGPSGYITLETATQTLALCVNAPETAGQPIVNNPLTVLRLDASGSAWFSSNFFADGRSTAPIVGVEPSPGAGTDSFQLQIAGNTRILSFAVNWWFGWDVPTGNFTWMRGGVTWGAFDNSNGYFTNYVGPCAGNGPYVDISDERVKTAIEPETRGLEAVKQLQPKSFERGAQPRDRARRRREISFIAQDVQSVLPEAVVPIGVLPDGPSEPTLGITDSAIVAVLVNAVKQLAAKVEALEAKS